MIAARVLEDRNAPPGGRWIAIHVGYDGTGVVGSGATPDDALDDLNTRTEDDKTMALNDAQRAKQRATRTAEVAAAGLTPDTVLTPENTGYAIPPLVSEVASVEIVSDPPAGDSRTPRERRWQDLLLGQPFSFEERAPRGENLPRLIDEEGNGVLSIPGPLIGVLDNLPNTQIALILATIHAAHITGWDRGYHIGYDTGRDRVHKDVHALLGIDRLIEALQLDPRL